MINPNKAKKYYGNKNSWRYDWTTHTHTHTQHSFKNMRRKVEGYEKSKNYNKTSICAIRLKT